MRHFGLFLFVFFTHSIFAVEVAVECKDRLLANINPTRTAAQFWESEKEFLLGRGAKAAPFRFGFDAELWNLCDSINIVSQNPKSFKELDKELRRKGPKYTLKELQAVMGLPTEEATRLALRNPMVEIKANTTFVLTDITYAALKDWHNSNAVGSQYAEILVKWVDHSLKARKIPVTAILENDSGPNHYLAVELVLDGSISKPVEFKRIIDWLFLETIYPQTHFHVSIPAKHIEVGNTINVARAVETKLIFDLLVLGAKTDGETIYPQDRTSFSNNIQEAREQDQPQIGRGIVRVEGHRWKKPDAHDIELRDWDSKDHALEMMYVLMELASKDTRLRDTAEFRAKTLRNNNPPNLNGALRYAAFLLEGRLPQRKKQIPAELVALAVELETAGKVDDQSRAKVTAYLIKNEISRLLTPEHFLAPQQRIITKINPNSNVQDINSLRMGEFGIHDFSKHGYEYDATNFLGEMDEWGFTEQPIENDSIYLMISDKDDDHVVSYLTLTTKGIRELASYGIGPKERVVQLSIRKLPRSKKDLEKYSKALKPAIRFAFQDLLVQRLVMSTTTPDDVETKELEKVGFKWIRTSGTRKFYEFLPNADDLEYQRTHTHREWH